MQYIRKKKKRHYLQQIGPTLVTRSDSILLSPCWQISLFSYVVTEVVRTKRPRETKMLPYKIRSRYGPMMVSLLS